MESRYYCTAQRDLKSTSLSGGAADHDLMFYAQLASSVQGLRRNRQIVLELIKWAFHGSHQVMDLDSFITNSNAQLIEEHARASFDTTTASETNYGFPDS
jgi:hypothetical protein